MPVRGSALLLVVLLAVLTACGGGGSSDGGDALPLGTESVVDWQDPSTGGKRTKLGITVTAVRKGSQEELKRAGFEVDEDGRDASVYYVDARYTNKGQETVTKTAKVGLEDSDGNLIGSTLVFNYGDVAFPPCTDATRGELAPGESFEDCTLFLVPKGTEVGKVEFLDDKGGQVEGEFVYWNVE